LFVQIYSDYLERMMVRS